MVKMDFVLIRRRNKSVISLKTVYIQAIIYFFAFFMIGGNFFRFFSLISDKNSISIIEIAFYLISIPLYFSKVRKSLGLLCAIGLSTGYGFLQHGWETLSILYSCKLLAMIIAGVALGDALFWKYAVDPKKGLIYLKNIFLGVMLVGWTIFLLFPNAQLFFSLLNEHKIIFHGDPHQNRFISPFFDPNYYAAIACIPFMLSLLLKRYFWAVCFFISVLFTWSRSGITTFVLLLCVLFFLGKAITGQEKLNLRKWKIFGLCGAVFLILIPYFSEEISIFCNRFFYLSEDASALNRLESFKMGLHYFLIHPFFGWGFDYFAKAFWEETNMTAIDSSVLFTLINFGLIPFLCFLFIGIYLFFNHFFQILSIKDKNAFLMKAFFWLYIYLLIIVLFTSQFNHIIYYQFWLIPFIALFTFLENWRKIYEKKNSFGP